MANGLETFGDILSAGFGHPVDGLAEIKGANIGSQINLRAASTESALAEARDRRAKAVLDEKINAARDEQAAHPIDWMHGDPNAIIDAALAGGHGNFDQVTAGRGNLQKQGFADILADPTADPNKAFHAGEAIKGEAQSPFAAVGGAGQYVDLRAPQSAPVVSRIGEAQIAASHALADKRTGGDGKPLLRTSNGVAYQSLDGGQSWQPIVTAEDAAARAAQQAAATAAGTATGGKQAMLESSLNATDEMKNNVVKMLNHPGFNGIYGTQGVFPNMPGGQAAGAEALRNQLNSESFRASIGTMKGFGSLSNAEGEKVQTALTRATTPGLSAAEARTSYADLLTSLDKLEKVARTEAAATHSALQTPNQNGGQNPHQPTSPGPKSSDFNTVEEAEAANLPAGTKITIGGRSATVQ